MPDEGRIFVGNLSYKTNEETLESVFKKFGNIEMVKVIRERDNGMSRGFGFVKFDNADSAKEAMLAINGQFLEGRNIRVDEAGMGEGSKAEFQAMSRGGGGGYGGGGGRGGYGNRSGN
ncbi:cold-inducible RNA-binding protein B-like [Brachionichthys hirsutus]|uniref:cold-inducible RNA-binding protein B-like n=1 Tax=Brachionichthys hirsutus TaxID=412623 RepID=UPI0036053347